MRNAFVVVMAMGGSTNVVLHGPEIARAAGLDLWDDVLSQQEFNELSHRLPVLVNMRPFGAYSMVDVDAIGGVGVIVKELLAAGELDGSALTCTGETLAEQIERLDLPAPDGEVVLPVSDPFKPTGGLRLLRGNLAPEGGAILKVAGVEGGIVDGRFTGRARVFEGEAALIATLEDAPDSFADGDIVIVRYEGPSGAPGMPEMLDPTSRITALCRAKGITVALMTDGRFSGGSVGLVIGHVSPEAFLGGPIALIHDGDTITVDLNADRLDCLELDDTATREQRAQAWDDAVAANGGIHPDAPVVTTRVLQAHPRHRELSSPRRGCHERLTRLDRIGHVPEILEVETARALLDARALDREIAKVHAPDAWFLKRGLTPPAARAALTGQSFTHAHRRGKLILVDLSSGAVLGLHLGMSGRVLVDDEAAGDPLLYASNKADPAWHRFGVTFDDGGTMFLRDPRRLGAVELDPDEDRLGPDAFDLTLAQLRAICAKSRAPIKAVIMDQSRIAGLGNLLCDEALWRAGIDPARPAHELADDEVKRLHRAIRDTLRILGRRGGSHTGDLTSARGPGLHCPKDGAPLLRRTVGGRTTYSCPLHQVVDDLRSAAGSGMIVEFMQHRTTLLVIS